jgi:hypothetical protein
VIQKWAISVSHNAAKVPCVGSVLSTQPITKGYTDPPKLSSHPLGVVLKNSRGRRPLIPDQLQKEIPTHRSEASTPLGVVLKKQWPKATATQSIIKGDTDPPKRSSQPSVCVSVCASVCASVCVGGCAWVGGCGWLVAGGWLWVAVGSCGWLWECGCGWLWVDGCGWVAVGGCGWLWVAVET